MFGDGVSEKKSLVSLIVLLTIGSSFFSIAGDAGNEMFEIIPFSPPASGNWTVSGNEFHNDTVLIVNGNLTITGSLHLDNTTLMINQSTSVQNTITVMSGGSLTARNGSLITGNGSAPFFMKAESGSYVEINGSSVRGCGAGLEDIEKNGIYVLTDRFFVNGSSISQGYSGIIGSDANISVKDSEIVDMFAEGIMLLDGSKSTLYNLNLSFIGGSGLALVNSSVTGSGISFDSCFLAIDSTGSNINIRNTGLTAIGERAVFLDYSVANFVDCYPDLGGTDLLTAGGATGPSIVELLNTTLSMVEVFDSTVVRQSYRLDFRVMTNGGEPAHLADVEVVDRNGRLEWQGITGPDGWILDRPVTGIIYNNTGAYINEPHRMNVLFEGAMRSKIFNVSDGHYQVIDAIIINPEIEILSPGNNSWLPSRSVTIEGIIQSNRPVASLGWFLDNGPEVVLDPSREFSIDIDFGDDGEHDIRIRCMNDDGKFDEETLHFGIDTIDPVLEIDYPPEGIYVNNTILTIDGYCEPGPMLIIEGAMVPHDEGDFSFDIYLVEGENTIEISAIDRAGNTVAVTRKVYLDTTPPSIRVFTPVNGTRTKNNWIEIEGAVSHDTSKLLINGEQLEFDIRGFSFLVEDLVEGLNRIRIEATDRTGSVAVSYLWIMVDTLVPSLSVNTPPSHTNSREIEISGTTEAGTTVLVDGNQATLNGTRFVSTVDLYNGRNNVSISSTDPAGNTITLYYDIILDTEKPTFERISPLDRSTFDTIVVNINGMVYDDYGVRSITGYNTQGVSQQLATGGEFEWVVTLEPGENSFTIEAEDLAGNIRTTTLVYTYDPSSTSDRIAPKVTITDPFSNETLQGGKVTIKGTASDDIELFRVRVRIDGGDWTNANGTANWTLEVDLDMGIHLIEAMAEDTSGNSATDTIKVRVVSRNEEEPEDDDNGDLSGTFTLVGVIIIVVAIFLVTFLFIRNQKLREQWAEERMNMEEGPDRRLRRPSRTGPGKPTRPYRDSDEPSPERRRRSRNG